MKREKMIDLHNEHVIARGHGTRISQRTKLTDVEIKRRLDKVEAEADENGGGAE